MISYTDMTVLLDRSGSMASLKQTMESALDELFTQHKKVPSTRVTFVQFDSDNPYEVICENTPIRDVPKVTLDPRGMTPLCDSLCRAIDATGRRLKALSDRPDKVLFIIITDGAENSSREFKKADVKRRIDHQNDRYNWNFLYLGANQDAIQEAASLGIGYGSAMNFTGTKIETQNMMRSVTSNTVAYANMPMASSSGASASVASFTDEDRKKAVKNDNSTDPNRLP